MSKKLKFQVKGYFAYDLTDRERTTDRAQCFYEVSDLFLASSEEMAIKKINKIIEEYRLKYGCKEKFRYNLELIPIVSTRIFKFGR